MSHRFGPNLMQPSGLRIMRWRGVRCCKSSSWLVILDLACTVGMAGLPVGGRMQNVAALPAAPEPTMSSECRLEGTHKDPQRCTLPPEPTMSSVDPQRYVNGQAKVRMSA